MQPKSNLAIGILLGVPCLIFGAGYRGDLAVAHQQETLTADPHDNEELAKLYGDDQSDRKPNSGRPIDAEVLVARDKNREDRVKTLYEAREIRTGMDDYRAAMILQQAGKAEDYLLAHEFCIVALAKGEPRARWLAAATEDRFLMRIGRPQRFGTQYRSSDLNEPIRLYEVGRGVTDDRRKELNVPSLDEARKREAEMNKLFKIKKS